MQLPVYPRGHNRCSIYHYGKACGEIETIQEYLYGVEDQIKIARSTSEQEALIKKQQSMLGDLRTIGARARQHFVQF